MAYASTDDMIDRFGLAELVQLTNREGGTVVVQEVLDRALADADAEIDGYLAVRYPLPLTSTPPAIVRVACDITRYRLFEHDAPPAVAKRYEHAAKFLDGISRGVVSLGVASDSPAAISGGPQGSSSERVFSRESLADYEQ